MKRFTFTSIFAALLLMTVAAIGADLYHNILPKVSISPDTSVSDNTVTTGAIIDRLGYNSVTYVIETGTLVDNSAVLTPTVQECAIDNCADAATATALIGTVAGATFAGTDDNTVKSIGYGGTLRYTRLVITPSGNTDAVRFGAVCILGHKQYGPAQ